MKGSHEFIESARKELTSIKDRIGSLLHSIMGLQAESEAPGAVAVEEAPVEEAPVSETEVLRVDRNGEPTGEEGKKSKSDLVREYLRLHGDRVRNKDVVEAIKKEHGVDIAPSLVSYLKGRGEAKAEKKTEPKKKAPRAERAISGSAVIRQYLEAHGLEASNDEAVKYAKSRGFEVRATLVSSVRANLKRAGFKASKNGAAKVRTAGPKRRRKSPTMTSVVVSVLKKAGGEGLELKQVAKKALKSGYEYRGKKNVAGFTQNVYQALHTLSKKIPHPGYKGRVAVVLHEGHLYKLNPRAMRDRVA